MQNLISDVIAALADVDVDAAAALVAARKADREADEWEEFTQGW